MTAGEAISLLETIPNENMGKQSVINKSMTVSDVVNSLLFIANKPENEELDSIIEKRVLQTVQHKFKPDRWERPLSLKEL